jgi:glutamate--cysteine ligase
MTLIDRLNALGAAPLAGMRRGVEREGLRVNAAGRLARTPHPAGLGSPLTHSRITTDYSESQLELITGVRATPEACVDELERIHRHVYHVLATEPGRDGDELLWAGSMPCGLPPDENIPIGSYGTSHIARAKSVYRMGLGQRYGRRMQTISGIHYNWSMPGLGNEQHFALIRNFRRHSFLLLTLFGASPAVCECFVAGRTHDLEPLEPGTFQRPYATSLRMGRLGYQSEAQASLAVSYNSLESYAASLHDALTRPYPPYEQIGVRNLGGEYNQLGTTLLQIENEFYGSIRPKRVIKPGERPLHALRERGVEYVEVRLMDLDPFVAAGIEPDTLRFLDVFLLHCLLSDSPADTPEEIAALGRNQHHTATHGREPGLRLERFGQDVLLVDWALQILDECLPIAQALDAANDICNDTHCHVRALQAARERLLQPEQLPSARVMAGIQAAGGYTAFMNTRAEAVRQELLALPWTDVQQKRFLDMAVASNEARARIEAGDSMDFESYRQAYLSPERLEVRQRATAEA